MMTDPASAPSGAADIAPRPTLLLVDDDAPLRERLARALDQRGFAVTTADSVAAGVKQAGSAAPDFAVVDLRLGDGSAARLADVQRIALDLAESATILSAPHEWKQGIDVWGAAPAGLEVMTEIREQFDPKRTLNPGRFAGFL